MIQFEPDRYLTPHFQEKEFVVSSDHPDLVDGVELHEEEIQNFLWLSLWCLEPVRDIYGPVMITSAFRPVVLNERVGGHIHSQHLYCEAVDFYCPKSPMAEVYDFIVNRLDWLGQCFYYAKQGHIHVALPRVGLKRKHGILET